MNFKNLLFKNIPALRKVVDQFTAIQPFTQEHLDLYLASTLLLAKKQKNQLDRRLGPADFDKIYASLDILTTNKLKELVNKSIDEQTVVIYNHIHDIRSNIEETNKSLDQVALDAIFEKVGFILSCKQSKILNSGDGVFVKTKQELTPGTVIAFYPGLVHLPEFTIQPSYLNTLLPDDDLFLMSRYDYTVIDGRTTSSVVDERNNHRPCQSNPYALAHKVNHPSSTSKANVLQVAYNFPGDPLELTAFPEQLRQYIPNKYAKDPTLFGTWDRSACMRTVALISIRPIADGEELYMDYRLNTSRELPSWYTPYNEEDASRRWR